MLRIRVRNLNAKERVEKFSTNKNSQGTLGHKKGGPADEDRLSLGRDGKDRLAFADGHFVHGVPLFDRIDDVLTFGDFTEDGVLAVQPRRFDVGDEELRTVGVRAGVGHRENAWSVVLQVGVEFVLELVAGTAGSGTVWAAGLNHEVGDDAMELEPIVEAIAGELLEVADRFRNFVVVQFQLDGAFARFDGGDFHPISLSASG